MKAFADKVLEWKSWVQAALETYDTDKYSVAWDIARENMRKPQVQEYLQSLWYKARSFLEKVLDGDNIDGKNPDIKTRVDVAKHIDDKVYGKAIQSIRQDTINYNIDVSSLSDEELDKLIHW